MCKCVMYFSYLFIFSILFIVVRASVGPVTTLRTLSTRQDESLLGIKGIVNTELRRFSNIKSYTVALKEIRKWLHLP